MRTLGLVEKLERHQGNDSLAQSAVKSLKIVMELEKLSAKVELD